MLALAFSIRSLLFSIPGYKIDIGDFAAWFQTAAQNGIRPFYSTTTFHDYPPFSIYLFWFLGSLASSLSLFGTPRLVYLIKLPSNIFDLATAFLIFSFVRRRSSFKSSFAASALYAFNPAAVFDGAIWGQWDGIYTFFMILSLISALDSRPKLSAATYSVALLTKPQSVALLPLIVFFIAKKYGWKSLLASTLTAAATILIVILPFEWSNPVTFLLDIYAGAANYSGYRYTSMNAFNIWALGGFWKSDAELLLFFDLFTMGWILFGASTGFALYVLHKRFKASGELMVLFSAFVLSLSFFMLPTRIHERYIFPVLSVSALMLPFAKETRPIYIILSLTGLVNQAYVLSFLNAGQFILGWDPVVFSVSSINLLTFLYVLTLMWRELKGRSWLSVSQPFIGGGEPVS